MRTCIATREDYPQADLVRIFAGPTLDDPSGPLESAYIEASNKHRDSGRGAWVLPTADAIRVLVQEPKRVARALKLPSIDTSALLERAQAMADARMLDFLSLSSRSGRLASGADAATMAVRAGDAAALLVASDASAGSVADIKGARDIPVYILPLDREALGRRIGKGDRAVIALRRGGPATDLLKWLQRRVALSA